MRGGAVWAVLLLATAALAACNPSPPAARATPSPSARAIADAEVWSGHWTAAERSYRELTGADAHAASHLALLLVYEGRFVEAVADARLAVSQSPDSDTYARLARALDWSEDIPGAIAAGALAVTSTPADPVAFSFDAEALADGGRFDEALAMLKRADGAARTPFEHAEALREWSNYYGDRGQRTEAIRDLELARRAQPGFPERSLELGNHDFAAGAPGLKAARSLLDQFLRQPQDPAVLAAAGDAAWSGGDRTDSKRYYRAALSAAPGDPPSSLGLAEVLVAGDKDAQQAHDILAAALARHPDAEAVAEYLYQLDSLVLHGKDAAPSSTPALDSERRAALDLVNGARAKVGLPVVQQDQALSAASEAHAYYVLFNWGNPGLAGLGVHAEDPAQPGFTGQNSAERDRHFGYPGFQSAEILNHTFTAAAAVGIWVDSVYHRLPVIGRESSAMGFGEAQVGSLAVNVMDFGVGAAETGSPIVYPYRDQTNVPAAFVGNEVPDPAPNATYPVGYPITIAAGGADTLSIAAATVTPAGGSAVSVIVDPPGKVDLDPNEAAIIPSAPLMPGVTYTVKVSGQLDGRPWSDSWTFQVAA